MEKLAIGTSYGGTWLNVSQEASGHLRVKCFNGGNTEIIVAYDGEGMTITVPDGCRLIEGRERRSFLVRR